MRKRKPTLLGMLMAFVTAVGPFSGCGQDDTSEKDIGKSRPIELIIYDTSKLAIGKLPEFPYQGGNAPGTITLIGKGKTNVVIPAETMKVANLEILKTLVYVAIKPKDLLGSMDLCSGVVELSFDAIFTPTMFGKTNQPMVVITQLTTETSSGEEKTLKGSRMTEEGELNLVGIARVEKTGDATVDNLLGLPADAATNMVGRIDFPEGRFLCSSD